MPLVATSERPMPTVPAAAPGQQGSKVILHIPSTRVGIRPAPLDLCQGDKPRKSNMIDMTGQLWLTETRLTFFPQETNENTNGFHLDYPSIALHAISRFVPEELRGSDLFLLDTCLYCQLDDHPERDDEDENEEENGEVKEMWILVQDSSISTFMHAQDLANSSSSEFAV